MEFLHAFYRSADFHRWIHAMKWFMLLVPLALMAWIVVVFLRYGIPFDELSLDIGLPVLGLLLFGPVSWLVTDRFAARAQSTAVRIDDQGVQWLGNSEHPLVNWREIEGISLQSAAGQRVPALRLHLPKRTISLSAYLMPAQLLASRELLLSPTPRWRLPDGRTEELDLSTSDLLRLLRQYRRDIPF